MASDQMLANSSISSKKQQQLEAGKKRLEQFRKKKAAAKKAASTNSANGDIHETKPPVSDTVQVIDDTSNSGSELHVGKNEKKSTDVHLAEPHSTYTTHANPVSGFDKSSANPEHSYSTDVKLDHDAPYGSGTDHYVPPEELNNTKLGFNGYGMDIEKSRAFRHSEEDIYIKSNHISTKRLEDAPNNSRDDRLKDNNSVTVPVSIAESFPERSQGASFVSISSQNGQPANGPTYRDSSSVVGKSLQGVLEHRYNPVSTGGGGNDNNLVDHPVSESYSSLWSSESISTGFRSESIPSHNQTSMSPGVSGRRPRPSFLVSRNSSTSLSQADTDTANPFSSKFYPVDAAASSNNRNLMNSSASMGDLFRQNELDIERKNDFNSTKQNEDFAALEQHIEDLTQEKFSLQRALEASRVLAESLATENSALTDSYNQQGSVVNQLKSDMERLQEEITAQLVELDAVRNEYGNARLECSAADERAKLLASEVIGLEDKALRLRSNELKLERQLENMEAEMSSQKRKISSLEKERQDLQFTIDALQEEKKVLQSKLRKAPPGTGVDVERIPTAKKEASTTTDDLVDDNEHTTPATSNLTVLASLGESDASSTSFQSQSRHLGFDVSSSSIPPDQMRMIQNINTLISELQLEKEELVQALSTESSLSSKLKDLNKELSQKLEVQTQRLELLTSRSMVSDNIPTRKAVPHIVVDNTPYADEGDEVVERVLGWIMKLFPGGPSRRQTKHL